MGPIGLPEMLIIAALALLLFGPRKLPEIGRSIGKAFGEFKRASDDLKRTFNAEIALEESQERARQRMAAAALPAPAGSEPRAPRAPVAAASPPPIHSLEHAEPAAQGAAETAAPEAASSVLAEASPASPSTKVVKRPRAARPRKVATKAEPQP